MCYITPGAAGFPCGDLLRCIITAAVCDIINVCCWCQMYSLALVRYGKAMCAVTAKQLQNTLSREGAYFEAFVAPNGLVPVNVMTRCTGR